jgi:hypothetical protein
MALASVAMAAQTTIGQLAPPGSAAICNDPSTDVFDAAPTSGASYLVAAGYGTITSWSTEAATGAGQMMKMKVFRPLGGGFYMVVAHDGPRALTPSTLNTFQTNIPVQAGDILGIDTANADLPNPTACLFKVEPAEQYSLNNLDIADGNSGDFFTTTTGQRPNISAVLDSSTGGTGLDPTSTSVTCTYVFATFSERCTAAASGGARPPTGRVTFSSSSGGVFPFGNTCTLANPAGTAASCQVTYDPPSQSLGTITTLQVAAGYAGDGTHAPSSGVTSPTTAAAISGLQGDITQACRAVPGTFNPQTVLVNGMAVTITVPVPGTVEVTVAFDGAGSSLPIAADRPSATAAAGGGATPPSCMVTFDGSGGTLPLAPDLARARHRVVNVAHLRRRFTTRGGKITLHVKLNPTGRRLLRKLVAADKAWKRHHRHGRRPKLRLRVTITYKPL